MLSFCFVLQEKMDEMLTSLRQNIRKDLRVKPAKVDLTDEGGCSCMLAMLCCSIAEQTNTL
jgi:hypothetical protein